MAEIKINCIEYPWYQSSFEDYSACFSGTIWVGSICYRKKKACEKIIKLFTSKDFSPGQINQPVGLLNEIAESLTGHFAFLIDTPDFIIACVDKVRSIPVFFSEKDSFLVSNSALIIQQERELFTKNADSCLEFEMSGYVSRSNTLIQSLSQLQAGELLFYRKADRTLTTSRYFLYYPDKITHVSEKHLLSELDNAVSITFEKLIESLDGKPVWIPLSGGLDSRLILSKLLEFGYDNITTFSYGVEGLWDIKRAKEIAEYLKVKWHYTPFQSKKIKKMLHDPRCEQYFKFASGLSAVPMVSDLFSLIMLKNEKKLPNDAILINGQTGDYLTGGHIPRTIDNQNSIDAYWLSPKLIDKHYSLWTNLKTEKNIEKISGIIFDVLGVLPADKLTFQEFAQLHEWYEWQERQAKYVVNGQRMYDWLKLDWRLPLWSDELMMFWKNIPWDHKIGQHLFKKYLVKSNPKNVFRKSWQTQPYSYSPISLKCVYKIYYYATLRNNEEANKFVDRYLRYFMTYGPLYPHTSYRDFLKDSKHHRSPVSYFAKQILKLV
jgi:asparagine synthase (glutamine-hydrolysing)